VKRFLISRLSALGDTVCSLPVAVSLKRTFPDAHITWVVDPRFAGVVECCRSVDEVRAVRPNWRSIPTYPDRFEAALDLQGLLKSALMVARAKAARKVGFHWAREGAALFYERVLPDPTSMHVVDQYVDVARAVGAQADRAEFDLKPKEEDVLAVRRKLKERGVGGRIVIFNPGASVPEKRWPSACIAAAIEAVQSFGLQSVLIGGPGATDRQVADEVARHCAMPPASMVGETSVRELIALIRLASAHVGGDTGSTHIAAAMDIPAVGLYSTTRPERSCPYGQIASCHFSPDGLAHIQPDAVIATLRDILDRP
jgi:lipopolysaccharide heptosyltransferase I